MTGDAARRLALSGRSQTRVSAPVDAVWRVVADVTRVPEWSHECDRVHWLEPAGGAVPGARFRGHSRSGWLRWTRTCEIVSVDAPREIRWRTIPTWRFVDSTDWRIALTADADGTQIVQTFQVTKCPAWWAWLMGYVNRPHRDRSAALDADLRRLAALATREANADPNRSQL